MVRLEISATIATPIERVFGRLTDLEGYSTWLHRSVLYRGTSRVDGELHTAEGTEFVDRSTIGTLQGRVVAYEPPTLVAFEQVLRWRGRRRFVSRPAFVLAPTAGGTQVRHVGEAELCGWLVVLTPVVHVVAHLERRRVVRALRRSLERES